jgi:hypothetical protein
MPGQVSLQFISRFLLLAIVCLLFAVLGVQLHVEHRKSIGQFKENERLSLSEVQFGMLDWKKPAKEFYLNGYLYDVVSIKKSGKNILLCVYRDREESSLHAFWNRLSGRTTADVEIPLFFSLMSLPGLIPSFGISVPESPSFEAMCLPYKCNYIQQDYSGLLSPPPEV